MVQEQIIRFYEEYQADEMMINSNVFSIDDRLRSYRLIAENLILSWRNKNYSLSNAKGKMTGSDVKMELNRAKQILSSSADIEVKYNGVSVWIDKINEDGKTATVHLRGPNKFEERSDAEISQLTEE